MTSEETAYWTAVVQVLPVFGLAVVLEARTLIQRWDELGIVPRRVNIWILALAAGGIGFGFAMAVMALRSGETPNVATDTVVIYATNLAVGLTLTSPVLMILTAVHSDRPPRALRRAIARRRHPLSRDLRRKSVELAGVRRRAYETWLRQKLMVEDARKLRSSAIGSASPELFSKIETALISQERAEGDIRRSWRRAIVFELNWRCFANEFIRVGEELTQNELENLARAKWSVDPVAGFRGLPDLSHLHEEQPDDGGFLSPGPRPAIPDPEWITHDGIILDPATLYLPRD